MAEFKIVRRAENGAEITTETMDVFPTLEEAVIALKNRRKNYDASCYDDVVESNETMFRCFSYDTYLNTTIEKIFAIVEAK